LSFIQDEAGTVIMADDFDFWNDHSIEYLGMAYMWDRRKSHDNPDGSAQKTGDCGDSIRMYLQVTDGKIKHLFFDLDGCINTNACCNVVASMVEDHPVSEGWQVTAEQVIEFLGTLPDDHYHCAELAVGTFYLTLADYEKRTS